MLPFNQCHLLYAKGAGGSKPHCLLIGPVTLLDLLALRMSCQLGGQTWREIAWRDRQQHFDTWFRRLHRTHHCSFVQTGGWKGDGFWHLLHKQCANFSFFFFSILELMATQYWTDEIKLMLFCSPLSLFWKLATVQRKPKTLHHLKTMRSKTQQPICLL